MKVAIHHRDSGFSQYWIKYCKENKIEYRVVNAFDSDIIEQVKNYDVFMWHHHQSEYRDTIAARKILNSLEHAGTKVFPNFNTGWFFDDKVAQKYLLEAIDAPIIPSYIFYDKKKALKWAEKTTFPKVWKLKGGSSGANVLLVHSQKEAKKLIKRAFGRGFSQFNKKNYFLTRYKQYKAGKDSFIGVLKGFGRLFIKTDFAKMACNEKGYAYFQDFMPNNNRDNRIIVIDKKAFGVSRLVPKGDFRSGDQYGILSDKEFIDKRCVAIAHTIADKLDTQSIGIDFIFDEQNDPVIAEMGYGFIPNTYKDCPGYWDKDLNWYEEKFNPQEWMIEAILKH